ncbi:MAG: DUF364 domain-containing protein [Pseudomonadota bacterium]
MTASHVEGLSMKSDDAIMCEQSVGVGFSDTMPLSKALHHLGEAGWIVGERNGYHTIGIGEARPVALPLGRNASDDLPVNGHGILRAVGRGGLDRDLALSVSSDAVVDEVLVGLNWTLVTAGSLTGIARSPDRGTEGARTARDGEPIAGRPLRELALWICSLDPLRRSIGLAAVNAYWNRQSGVVGTGPHDKGPWGFARFDAPGEGLIIIGGFRGALERLNRARVIEREPKGNDIPATQAAEALREAPAVAITAQTLMNGSLEPLLHHAAGCPRIMLVGPSTPVAPILHAYGIAEICGLGITDPDRAAQFIKETGTMVALDSMTSQLGLVR